MLAFLQGGVAVGNSLRSGLLDAFHVGDGIATSSALVSAPFSYKYTDVQT